MITTKYLATELTHSDGGTPELQSDAQGHLKTVATGSSASILTTTMQSAVSATANGTAQAVSGYASARFEITGTFVATVTFEGSRDGGTTYYSINASNSSGVVATTATTTGLYMVTCSGLTHIRGRVTWTSGTSITVVSTASVEAATHQLQPVKMADKLDAVNDKVVTRAEANSFSEITASTLIRTGATTLKGFFLSSTTGGTVKIWDNTAASGTVAVETITPTVLGWYDCGDMSLATGCYVTIGGTIAVTIVYKDNTIV